MFLSTTSLGALGDLNRLLAVCLTSAYVVMWCALGLGFLQLLDDTRNIPQCLLQLS